MQTWKAVALTFLFLFPGIAFSGTRVPKPEPPANARPVAAEQHGCPDGRVVSIVGFDTNGDEDIDFQLFLTESPVSMLLAWIDFEPGPEGKVTRAIVRWKDGHYEEMAAAELGDATSCDLPFSLKAAPTQRM